ncbi:MAG TPA: CHRD domain-containing protein [Gammaproteobacteria bacterium]
MRRNVNGLPVLAAACLVLAPLVASGEDIVLKASLSGPEASGDPDGRGEATLTIDRATGRIEARVTHSNIARPTAIHVRRGALGVDGNIVATFTIDSNRGNTLVGTGSARSEETLEQILAAPEEHYVVVLNDEFVVGALRGPLHK